MPILRCDGRLIYFAHVPKCAGTAIEQYLSDHCGPLALLDPAFGKLPAEARWSVTSPQHVDAASLARLFPAGFFDAAFTVVRHPVGRLASVYQFQRDIERRIPQSIGFARWLRGLAEAGEALHRRYDGHTRPMDAFVPDGATVFRLEDGLEPLVAWLRGMLPGRNLPDLIPARNVLARRLKILGQTPRAPRITPKARDLIGRLHARDFERFGYDPAEPGQNRESAA
ncbi:Sulfotransferase family protein [Roseovarius azorensis]|uniref:Sulfotransferase family protein n=1 Tax=Roseovarius azorensis TaxID=1287727 RepID=A0A1H7Q0A5_9RHOB|nr:sulfotransferase family 2 domain-containing protein [Roseovarius azorensis]SEL40717.1 Sulfotransferase family protein [Roseovarius azorensis]